MNKSEARANNKKQQADAAYLHAVDPNFAKTGFTLGDVSNLKTITDVSPSKGDDGSGGIVNDDITYQQDPYGRRVAFFPNQGVDNDGNPVGDAEYHQSTNINGRPVQVVFDEKGNFKNAYGEEISKNGHKFMPIYDQRGNIVKYADQGGDGFGDFAKMVALSALTAGVGSAFGGASGLGQSLYGLSGTAGQLAGGATLGAGRAALTGGSLEDVIRGGVTGGALSGYGGQEIGDTGINVGQAYKGIQALQSKNPLALVSAASSFLSPSGTGPSSKDFEVNSFPSTGEFPQPFTVDPSDQTPTGGLNATSSPLSDILPVAGKILQGVNTVKGLTNAIKGGPLSAISALSQLANSSAPQASRDKLPAPRADVRTLYPINNAPAYVPTSQLIPLNDFESLNKLMTG
jgi:hypothetical protein